MSATAGQLFANKKDESQEILRAIGVPLDDMTRRRCERIALALLAVANVRPDTPWAEAAVYSGQESWALLTREIITFWNKNYGENISSGSYDDVRRKDLIVLVEAGVVIRSAHDPNASTNNPTRRYAISQDAGDVLRTFGTAQWPKAVSDFVASHGNLNDRLERIRTRETVPVTLPDGKALQLSPGAHNELQRAIVEKFLPWFVPGAEVLYVGDSSNKILHIEEDRLSELGFFELSHDALPDVVAYDPKREWLFLIEAVHSSNPISKLRHLMLERMTAKCTVPRVYVSVFQNRESLRNWLLEISWETEVWLVDVPDHMIHFNGDKFFGPHEAG